MPDLISPPPILRLLAHDLRWSLLCRLTESDYRVFELVESLGQPMNLVSYHLKLLRAGGIVSARRSEADGRDWYYSLDLDALRDQFQSAGRQLHPALSGALAATILPIPRVLFLCTHNSARSQMAEGLLRHLSQGKVEVASAGSQPTRLHPDAIRIMDQHGVDIRSQQAKHISDLGDQSFDVVITVCDEAREVCPAFRSARQQIHWGFPDPTRITDPLERQRQFEQIVRRLQSRIITFLTPFTGAASA
jgi:ArsR family transcriptional regulator, arsenate/arsenite/antimonite-responsive transcriptional repressor / arsenate reductase (thioredoxin)